MDVYRQEREPSCYQGLQTPPLVSLLTELLLKSGKIDWFVLQFFGSFPESLCSMEARKESQLHLAREKGKEQSQRPGGSTCWRKCLWGSTVPAF